MPTRTNELVNEVFALTKIKLSSDDPLLAVILLQEQRLQHRLEQQSAQRTQQNETFLAQLDERQIKIDAVYSELIQYRERVVAELLAKNQLIAIQIENRVQRQVSGSIQRLRRLLVVCLTLNVLLLAGVVSVLLQMRG